ncbi:hypothetical protein EWH99_05220 [Sporolactobacillus sp. THM7-7]|nr:hypothetical protein EWH99_05220 [Sporolactobacillus sp. THM7-7]
MPLTGNQSYFSAYKYFTPTRILFAALAGFSLTFFTGKRLVYAPGKPAHLPARAIDRLRSISPDTNQLIVVTPGGYGRSSAAIHTYERKSGGKWQSVFSTPGIIGQNGFREAISEGSKSSPIGLFTITQAFGRKPNPGTRMPYHRITADDVWVDNPRSPFYNTRQSMRRTGETSEKMDIPAYDYGFVIDYNREKRIPGKGSAIFFHIAAGPHTLGCTAVSKPDMIEILKWLDPSKKPAIWQVPYRQLAHEPLQ